MRNVGLLHLHLSLPNGGDDIWVRSAPADVAAHIFPDHGVGVSVVFTHTSNGGKNLSWRAIAALEGVILDEGLLHGMQ